MGNNCGCFDQESDRLKESNCFVQGKKPSDLPPQRKTESRHFLDEQRLKMYTPLDEDRKKKQYQSKQFNGLDLSKMKDQSQGSLGQKNQDGTGGSTRQQDSISLNTSNQQKFGNSQSSPKNRQTKNQTNENKNLDKQQILENRLKQIKNQPANGLFSPKEFTGKKIEFDDQSVKNEKKQKKNVNDNEKAKENENNKKTAQLKNDDMEFEVDSQIKQQAINNIEKKKQKALHIYDFKKFKFMKNSDVNKRYTFGEKLGQGAFGQVRICTHNATGRQFAVKIMTKKQIEKQKIYVKLLQNELSILGEKSHPNIIRIIDLFEDDLNFYVVSELVKGGELFKRLTKLNQFTESQAADIIHQIMLGLNYMHLQNITHRDIKPENILLVSEDPDCFDIRIADLGFACEFDKNSGLDLVLGTPLYMAPELVKHEKYSEKVDVWSLGIITYQLLSGKTPFDGKNIKKINQNIISKELKFPEKQWKYISENAKDFIVQCLDRNQHTRPSIGQLFDHVWISEIQSHVTHDEEVQLNIQKNLIQFRQLTQFQKIVLSLISGLSATQEELMQLQKEFIRINKDKSGSINKHELETMTHSDLKNNDWGKIIAECDHSGTGVIDFQEFITACINRKKLTNKEEVKTAFKILDYNGDGKISLQDINDLFCSYSGQKMDTDLWQQLLKEADFNGDGVVSENEFTEAICNIIRNSLKMKKKVITKK